MGNRQHRAWTFGSIVLAIILWGALFAAIAQRQALADWWKLRGYTPSVAVSTIASEDTMTDYARHLFYVNRPDVIKSRSNFAAKCPLDVEKTIVLGCYIENDNGIYLYDVQDARLNGVVEVTAAHEMLHAAYARLSPDEKTRIDGLLTSYYQNDLTDARLKKTFAAYEKSGADVTNEMHSIFGTEVTSLPPALETYYRQYFTNRQAVVDEANRYEAEFTSREARVAGYDAQLAALKQSIDVNKASIDRQLAELRALEETMNTQKASGDTAGYNANVARYNRMVDAYNTLLGETKQDIEQYNTIVDARNAIASEERSLVKSLSGSSLPDSQ